MKIVFVQSGLTAGGAEKIVNLLARHRADIGDDVHVLAFSGTRESSYFHYDDDITINTLRNSRGKDGNPILRIATRTIWLRQKFRIIRPDVIVSFLTKINVLALIASRGLSIPVVISERNNQGKQDAATIWQKGIELFGPRAEGVVMQTNAAHLMLSENMRRKTFIIPNPAVNFTTIKRTSRRGMRIVAVGRLTRQKGFDLLLEAFAEVAAEAPHASLTIFGEGPEREALMAQARELAIDTRVTFGGLTETPGAWLAGTDIFILSSRYEGFPNVLVEALAGGVATIAFNCPWGPSDILNDGKDGLLVEPENVEALASAIRRLINDADLRARLGAAAPRAARRFNLPKVLAQWDSVIDQVTERKDP
jgi:glycosyltransferase involved in cell wall biosynthesis